MPGVVEGMHLKVQCNLLWMHQMGNTTSSQTKTGCHHRKPGIKKITGHQGLRALCAITDINPSNIMLTVDDESVLEHVEKTESENPLPRKVIDDVRTIYSSHKLGLPKDALWGQPVLCDFGEARIGRGCHKDLIQPELYRAPEVLFDTGWTSSVDIWSVATLVSHFFMSCTHVIVNNV